MSNEELVALIQGGEREKLTKLWEQVEKFVAAQARRCITLSEGKGGVEFEDLYNSGYLALVAAVDSFDPDAGKSFIGWLALTLKTAFAEAGGYRSRRQARDPLHRAGSIDAPVGEDGDCSVADLVSDPRAAQDLQDAEERIYLEQLHTALEKALRELPDQLGTTLRRRFYLMRTLEEIAVEEGVSGETVRLWQRKGLQALRGRQELQQFVEERTPYYLRVGVSEFQRTGESAVERIVLRRERLAEPQPEPDRPRLDWARLERQAAQVSEEYISNIDDVFIRISFRLRFLQGLTWKEVATVVGRGKAGSAVRGACLRYLDTHPNPNQEVNT